MSDPANVYALDDIRTITGRDVQPVVATAADVEAAIQKYAGMDSQVEALASIVADASEEDEDIDLDVGGRGSADRQARERDHDPGGGGPRLRRPHRADASATSASGSASTACCTSDAPARRTSRAG